MLILVGRPPLIGAFLGAEVNLIGTPLNPRLQPVVICIIEYFPSCHSGTFALSRPDSDPAPAENLTTHVLDRRCTCQAPTMQTANPGPMKPSYEAKTW